MKKITILTQYYYPEVGAPQTRLYETVEGLKKIGWQIQIITALPNYPKGKIFRAYSRKIYLKENQGETKIHRYWMYPSISQKAFPRIISMLSFSIFSLFSIYKIKKFQPNFILTESPPLLLGISGLILSKFSRAKHVLNVSDIWPLTAHELGAIKKGFLYRLIEKVEEFIYKNSIACIGQSEGIVKHLKQKNIENTLLYRNGINIEKYKKKIPNRQDKLKIVYAGLLGVAQDLLGICKNVRFDNVELHIYGDGVQRKQIEEYLKQSKKINIFLHNSLPTSEIGNELTKYDVAIIPLSKEIYGAIPSKIYESMAIGLPIIYSGGGEAKQIIIDNNIGWNCEPSDFESISKTINKVEGYSNKELTEYSDRCRKTAENIYDRTIQIHKLDKFLSNL